MAAVVGALRAELSAGVAQFAGDMGKASGVVKKFAGDVQKVGDRVTRVGSSMVMGLTLPILGVGAAAIKTAGDFETAMGRVQIATGATTAELAKMEALAREIGKTTVFSASQSATAMELLAKTGVSVTDILGGAAKATVDLAAATGSELDPAASAVSDTMNQFGLKAAALPDIVNRITGAVNESKLDFDDFQLAMGQAGGVAAAAGVDFRDFTSVLAGTSSMFASGSDAGTSFKTFLTTLVPKSNKAANMMKSLGLSFFEADGSMRSMSDIAQRLKVALGGLSDEARNDALSEMFGTDGMRTAVGLMKLGAEGLEDIDAKISKTNAAEQAAKRMAGFNGQLEQMKGSLEELAIVIGESGLLAFVTGLVTGFTGLIDQLSEVSPALVNIGVIIAGVVAALGPLIVVIGALITNVGVIAGALGAAGLAGALAAIVPFILPVVAAVAALIGAWVLFGDKIEPVLKEVGGWFQEAFGPRVQSMLKTLQEVAAEFSAAFSKLWAGPVGAAIRQMISDVGDFMAVWVRVFGVVLVRTLSAAWDLIEGAFKQIGNVIRFVSALLSGDWAGAWDAAGDIVSTALETIGKVLNALAPEAVKAFMALYQGVKTWLQDKLGAVFKWVADKLKLVGDLFFELYDRVVGHSYIPDMVNGVAEWMAKLDAGMVKPAKNATKKTAEAFKDLRDDVADIMDGLLTDAERSWRDYWAKLDKLAKGRKAGMLTEAEYQDALSRAATQRAGEVPYGGETVTAAPMSEDPTLVDSGVNAAAEGIVAAQDAAWEDTKAFWKGTVSEGMRAAFSGNFKDWAINWMADWAARGLEKALNDVTDLVLEIFKNAMSSTSSGGGSSDSSGWAAVASWVVGLFNTGGTTSAPAARADGGPVSAGSTYLVGEEGPELFTARQSGNITANDEMGMGGGVYIDARGAGPREVDELRRMFEEDRSTFKQRSWNASNEGIMRRKITPPTFG
jgi:TP901 family phage tail tape measure protein